MPILFDIWKLLAGIAIFLLGMKFLEESLQQLAGRPFKLFLKKQTSSKPKAILGGAIVAGILQSSSVVNLMVLAFVGANVIQMQNALAVILGTNLGSTFTNWIIAAIGFRLNIENFAFPVAGVFGIIMLLSNKGTRWHQWSKFLFGFGFLFIGLNYIKTGMEEAVKQVDLSSFNNYPAVVFLLLGFLITSLIQSSSATMAIVLSALHVNAVSLFAATAIILGSEVGTTLKIVLVSLKGLPAKKRVAFGNLLFNVITSLLIFIFLGPINRFVKDIVGIKDNLLALVFFQSLVNVICILLFYPFLNAFGRFLEKRFTRAGDETLFIGKVKVTDKEFAMVALENEIKHFLLCTIYFTRDVFKKPDNELAGEVLRGNYRQRNLMEQYEFLKNLHGESHSYAVQLQNNVSAGEAITPKLQQLIAANRNIMYAAKNIKDALPDIAQLSNSSNDVKYGFYQQAADKMDIYCKNITALLLRQKPESYFDDLSELNKSVVESYSLILRQLYTGNMHLQLSETEISTLINFNREMYSAYKSFVFAVKDYLLNTKQAAYFDELPGFIR
jgi:phosphate:Na+ symporter